MRIGIGLLKRGLCGVIVVGLLAGCVTTGEPRFSKNTDQEKALQKYTELGLRYVQQGKTVEARRPLKRALEIDSRSPGAHHALAVLFQKEQDFELADEHYRKALQYGPDKTNIRNNYAVFLFNRQRYEEAVEQFNKAAQDTLYDKRADVFTNLGVSYLQLSQQDQALAVFERAIAIDDSQSRALLEAALLHFQRGNVDTSRSYYTQFRRLVRLRFTRSTPRSLGLGVELARLSGDKDKEASYLMMLRNLYPDSPENQRYQ